MPNMLWKELVKLKKILVEGKNQIREADGCSGQKTKKVGRS
jgi:hypothetical protein